MSIPDNISKEHLEKAIYKIDEEGIPPKGGSQYYDVFYKGKNYPPKLIVSYANLFANGEILDRKQFTGGLETTCFKLLEENGFEIKEKKINFYPYLEKFITQSTTGSLKTKDLYPKKYKGLKVKVSFGQGVSARVPWISFLLHPNTTMDGIYPVYLYYKEKDLLVLAYGISETNKPRTTWKFLEKKLTINALFNQTEIGKPERYGESYVFKTYDTNNLPDEELIEEDLDTIITEYKSLRFNSQTNKENSTNIAFQIDSFKESAEVSGLFFSKELITRYVASLCTKPFVILTGLSGSGKTKLAQAFATWICEEESQYCIVPVGADWTNREPLLGYSNAIEQDKYVKPENGILDLLIKAKENLDKPHFIILDEMNLSHVERYFADFLSIMETGQDIVLFKDAEKKGEIYSKIHWPKNVFIIGTVNIDETTYMFSPKVLDRANTIEFRITAEEMELFLDNNSKPDLSKLKSKGANMARDFLKISESSEFQKPEDPVNQTLLRFFKELKKTGAEFGYRSASEIHQLLHNLTVINGDLKEDEKIDITIMQKLLPKLHGSRRKLVPVLSTLGGFCMKDPETKIQKEVFEKPDFDFSDLDKVKYPLSLEKISRMYHGVIENGFASYAEA
ncbi:MrcB family domain-containing protein [Autumnicola psychrophila]|uniref:DUF3578 domain-containing protein n=1 Tax=Autumnicola psychrophila TaxID=3075592 RepID=A0ABU3DRU8_9FLAO|nr:DUF3578 domain-containing protein [Zunongwangia sp. F225]MDT0686437.1 DUF3578 domain-containing protein [Zunongwangia sp. F225]